MGCPGKAGGSCLVIAAPPWNLVSIFFFVCVCHPPGRQHDIKQIVDFGRQKVLFLNLQCFFREVKPSCPSFDAKK